MFLSNVLHSWLRSSQLFSGLLLSSLSRGSDNPCVETLRKWVFSVAVPTENIFFINRPWKVFMAAWTMLWMLSWKGSFGSRHLCFRPVSQGFLSRTSLEGHTVIADYQKVQGNGKNNPHWPGQPLGVSGKVYALLQEGHRCRALSSHKREYVREVNGLI